MNTPTSPKVVVVEGIISAGKSEYLKMIKEMLGDKYNIVLVKEPVWKWSDGGQNPPSLLERFYKDPKRWGYHFQTKAFHDRIVENQIAYKNNTNVDVFLLERSCFTDTLFMNILFKQGVVDTMEMKDYTEWWNLWINIMPYTPDLFLYLKPDVNECMKRLKERNRNGEEMVSLKYQEDLQREHDDFFNNGCITFQEKKIPIITIQTNDNFRDDYTVKKRLSDQFERLLLNS